MTIVETIITKFTSGRFLAFIMISATACYLAIKEPALRDAFFALAGGLIREYFGKQPNGVSSASPDKAV